MSRATDLKVEKIVEDTGGIYPNIKNKQAKQIAIIYELIKQHPLGIMISSLEEALNNELEVPISRRTLLRRLMVMKDKGQIITSGSANNIRYLIPDTQPSSAIPKTHQLSQESEKIIAYIHQPVFNRKPVGYNFNFMGSYEPGETYYLSTSLREQLKSMGKSNFQQQPRSAQQSEQKKIGGTYVRNIYHRLLVDLSWASSHLEGNT